MLSKLSKDELFINEVDESSAKKITKIETSVNNTNDEVPTSKAVKDLIDSLVPVELTVKGQWKPQVNRRIPDPEGLTFEVKYKNGDIANDVGARLVSPDYWNIGDESSAQQTAYFSYTENGITVTAGYPAGIALHPVSLTITGDWSNTQYTNTAVDTFGLTFTVTYDDDSTAVRGMNESNMNPAVWGSTVGTQTIEFSYTENGVTASATRTATVARKPESLVITGDWSNTYQYVNRNVDTTGLTFTVNYNNNTSKTVLANELTIEPDPWLVLGSQKVKFEYTDNGITVNNTKTATVVKKPTNLVITSTLWGKDQYIYEAPDASELSFKVYYSDNTNEDKTISDISSVSPAQWSGLVGQQTATFRYTENGIEVTANKNATVVKKLTNLSVTGNWSNNQFYNTAPDTTGLTFTASYNNGTTATVTPSVSPSVWEGTGTQTATFSYTENGITIGGITKDATVIRKLDSLSMSGGWSYTQWAGLAVDTTGLVFEAVYNNGDRVTVTPSISPNVWDNSVGTQTATFSYTDSGITKEITKDANVKRKPLTLTITGSWSNTQWTGSAVDTTGLTFTVSYSNGATATVTPNISPNTWSSTEGDQTATFSHTENNVTVSESKSATVVRKLDSLSVSGNWDNTQWANTAPDTTGLTFTASYNNNTTATVTPSVSPATWSSTVGSQTATFSYTENGITKSTTKDANVKRKLTSLSVSGYWSNTQYTNTAVDYTGLTFTASYNNETTAGITPTSYNPTTWSGTIGTQTCTFYYSENGIEKSTTKSASVVSPRNWSSWKKVGGTIFYIDSTSTTYEFKNASGTVVSAPTVGTNCTNWTYRYDLDEYTKDKFYVYESATGLVTSKYWGYWSITTSATGNSIGAGKTNTSTVLAKTDTSSYASGSIWEYIRNMRTNKTNGCDDWFVGCEDEYNQLINSGTTGANWFSSNLVWSSREDDSRYVYSWDGGWDYDFKHQQCALVPLRAF